MEEEHVEPFKESSDLCQQPMDCPSHLYHSPTSSPPSLLLTYVTKALKPVTLFALVYFMIIVLSLVSLITPKPHEVVGILVTMLTREEEALGAACVRVTMKCLMVLIEFCLNSPSKHVVCVNRIEENDWP
ncbi:unnamed protein product [Sphenostylis stenocarpa]|uniref:RRP12 N-terminal HEAT domain-containing protein n=1 Tax=Sphenostylis stenocarpa TaxID=92480 RepID=A0AA86VRT1_9FABA|nr:unnamed protein product [Sphenostylis stenocarpa]